MSRIESYHAAVGYLVSTFGSARAVATAAAEAGAPGSYESWKRWIGWATPTPANQIRIVRWAESIKKNDKAI